MRPASPVPRPGVPRPGVPRPGVPRRGAPGRGVSRPGWVHAVNALTGTGGENRKSPVELVANAASVFTRSPYAEVTGLSNGRLGRWTDGVAAMRSDRVTFAAHWAAHNARVLRARAA